MAFLWISLAIFHLLSIAFMGLAIVRLFSNARRYKLVENRHTLLFGFLRIEHIVGLYILAISVFTAASLLAVQFIANR
jgi:hypothetical protein